ncbi:MAG: ATP-binding cassette domain-containing protein [Oscillospiraceae bacterium]
MIKVENLTIKYDGFLALCNVNFSVKQNTNTAILGVNGSGKTSLLKAISGINTNYSGNIIINNENINNLSLSKRVKNKIVLVPEGRDVFGTLTVKENLIVGGYTINKDVHKKIKSILEEFSMLKPFENKLAGKLSGGQQQILAIARAMMVSPKILLVDEPTMGLTPKNSKMVLDYLSKLINKNITVILASSTFKIADEQFQNKIYLENGKIKSS